MSRYEFVRGVATTWACALVASFLSTSPALAISSRTLLTTQGAAAGDQLGAAVAAAGDFDGDGRPDVLVGAPLNDAGGFNAGRVYLYSGASLGSPPTLFTGVSGEHLGGSVASAGDFNGDGYDDVIVGCAFNSTGGALAGRALIYYGGPARDANADVIFLGQAGEFLGSSVAGVGDVNGDGYDDVIVGAPLNSTGGAEAGRAYVFYGGAFPNTTADVILTGAAAGDQFGFSLAGAGDFNQDGFADLVVGTPYNDAAGADAGAAYLYFGGASPDNVADLTFQGAAAGSNFGQAVASAGDINGDRIPDLIVGAHRDATAGTNAGAAYVFLGGPLANTTADLNLLGVDAGDFFGGSVGYAGDVNHDGYADVIVGASGAGGGAQGQAYVFLGGSALDAVADLRLGATATGVDFGVRVAGAGDLDGDGYDDVLVGDVADSAGGMTSGRVLITAVFPYQVVSPNGGEKWVVGSQVTLRWRGHENADVELSTDGGRTYTTQLGGVGGKEENELRFTCPDAPTGSARVRLTVHGQVPNLANSDQSDQFFKILQYPMSAPVAVSSASVIADELKADADTIGNVFATGDFDSNGQTDRITSSPGNDDPGTNAGRAFVFLAADRSLVDAAPARRMILNGAAAGDAFGSSVASAGDFNGDGFEDIVVGAPRADVGQAADAGRAYIFYGGYNPDTLADVVLDGAAAGDRFGTVVAGPGDFDGDGYDDLLISAPYNDSNGADAGRVYLYSGGRLPGTTPTVYFNGRSPGDVCGTSIATRIGLHTGSKGDFLCKQTFGISDPVDCKKRFFAIGSPYADSGGVNAGAVYLIGYGLPPQPQHTFYGDKAGAHFGLSLARVPDWNGDGNDDLAIGAPDYDGIGSASGRVALMWLEWDPLNPKCWVDGCGGPAAIFDGQASGDRFGASLAAFDFTGDGLSDLLVGSPGSDYGLGGPDCGRVFGFAGRAVPPPPPIDPCDTFCPYQPVFVVDGIRSGDRLGSAIARVTVDPTPAPGFEGGFAKASASRGASADFAPGSGPGWRSGFVTNVSDSVVFHEINRYQLLSPVGGESWNVGALQTVSWYGNHPVDIQLSIDGGSTFQTIASKAGGSGLNGAGPTGAKNSANIRVPHLPTKFAVVRLVPRPLCPTVLGCSCPDWPYCPPPPDCPTCVVPPGFDQSDSSFTIQTSVALLSFVANQTSDGAALAWSTEPAVSPEGIAGYRLYRVAPGTSGDGTRIGPELLTEAHYTDHDAPQGASYRLAAVNGLQEEVELGRIGLDSGIQGLRVWPSPVTVHGSISVEFGAPMAAPGISATDLDVSVYDVSGRRVATLARGYTHPELGGVRLTWNLRGSGGGKVSPGLYFIRAMAPSAGLRTEHKVVVMP